MAVGSWFWRIQAIVRENAGAPQDLDDAAANLAVAEAALSVAVSTGQRCSCASRRPGAPTARP